MLKVTIFFSAVGDGWTETFWNRTITIAQALTEFSTQFNLPAFNKPPIKSLLAARRGILARGAFISHVRASVDGDPFNFVSLEGGESFSGGAYPPLVTTPVLPSAEVWTDLIVNMAGITAGRVEHRRTALRAVPEEIVTPPQQYTPNATWLDAFAGWVTQLTTDANGWCFRGRPSPPTATPITGFAVAADGRAAFLQPVPPGAPAERDIYILRGMKHPQRWKGTHSGLPMTLPAPFVGLGGLVAGEALFVGPTRTDMPADPAWTVTSGGTIQHFLAVTPAITSVTPVRLTSHKVGRPFGLPVGRRRPG